MKGNLLIVDDETALSQVLKELLAEEASHIFTADNGKEALAVIQQEKIDCVVSDIKMPVMDGIRFFQETRSRGHKMPFIFFTGHGNEDLRRQVAALGALEMLNKPNFDNLEEAVRRAFATDRD